MDIANEIFAKNNNTNEIDTDDDDQVYGEDAQQPAVVNDSESESEIADKKNNESESDHDYEPDVGEGNNDNNDDDDDEYRRNNESGDDDNYKNCIFEGDQGESAAAENDSDENASEEEDDDDDINISIDKDKVKPSSSIDRSTTVNENNTKSNSSQHTNSASSRGDRSSPPSPMMQIRQKPIVDRKKHILSYDEAPAHSGILKKQKTTPAAVNEKSVSFRADESIVKKRTAAAVSNSEPAKKSRNDNPAIERKKQKCDNRSSSAKALPRGLEERVKKIQKHQTQPAPMESKKNDEVALQPPSSVKTAKVSQNKNKAPPSATKSSKKKINRGGEEGASPKTVQTKKDVDRSTDNADGIAAAGSAKPKPNNEEGGDKMDGVAVPSGKRKTKLDEYNDVLGKLRQEIIKQNEGLFKNFETKINRRVGELCRFNVMRLTKVFECSKCDKKFGHICISPSDYAIMPEAMKNMNVTVMDNDDPEICFCGFGLMHKCKSVPETGVDVKFKLHSTICTFVCKCGFQYFTDSKNRFDHGEYTENDPKMTELGRMLLHRLKRIQGPNFKGGKFYICSRYCCIIYHDCPPQLYKRSSVKYDDA